LDAEIELRGETVSAWEQVLKNNLGQFDLALKWVFRNFNSSSLVKSGNYSVPPVFMLWWFGSHAHYSHKFEELEPEIPEYMKELKRFVREVVSTYSGPVYVVLDPEFNIGFLRKSTRFGLLMAEAAEVLREEIGNSPQVDLKIGLGIGDFGNKLRVEDEKEWESYRPSLTAAAPSMDFISFTQMPRFFDFKRSQWVCDTKKDTEWDTIHKNLPSRALHLSKWIKTKFDRPSMMHYYSALYKTSKGEMVHNRLAQDIRRLSHEYLKEGLFAIAPLDTYDDHSGNLHHDGFWCDEAKAGILQPSSKLGERISTKQSIQSTSDWTKEIKPVVPEFPAKTPPPQFIFAKKQAPTTSVAILSINPSSGIATGGTTVTIYGTGFSTNVASPTCLIAGISTTATILADNIATCTTPKSPGTLGAVNLSLRPNGATSSNQVTFSYTLPTPYIGYVFPLSASIIGGTPIILRGSNFVNGFNLRCQFGPLQPVNATFTGNYPDEISCISPQTLRARDVNLRVLYNGATLSQPVRFEFVWPIPSITKAIANSGTIVGGEVVTVYGQNFNDYFYGWCKFGNVYPTDAQVLQYSAYTRLICPAAPGAAIGCVNLTVSNDGVHWSNPVIYCYTQVQPFLASITPNFGPVNVKTNVLVSGKGFGMNLPSYCLFGNVGYSPAIVLSSTAAQCYSPLTNVFSFGLHNFTFVQQLNGTALNINDSVLGTFPFSSSISYAITNTLIWNYTLPVPTLTSLTPSSGPYQGGTQVTIFGTGFITYNYTGPANLLCFFGSNTSPVTVLTENMIRCDSPPSLFVGQVPVAVGYDQFSLSNNLTFTYLPAPPKVSYIDPPSGPVYGGNPVVVYGQFDRFSNYYCFFGTAEVQAVSVTNNSLICIAPPVVSCIDPKNVTALYDGLVPFSVVQDEYSQPSVKLWYRYFIPTPTIVDVVPQGGVDGTTVVISGKDFFPGTKFRCQFAGDLYSFATKIDEYHARCVVPPRKRGSFPAVIPLRVTNDLVSFSNVLQFTIQA